MKENVDKELISHHNLVSGTINGFVVFSQEAQENCLQVNKKVLEDKLPFLCGSNNKR